MAKKIINIGTQANDKSGDSLRVAGGKINDNFQELYYYLGDGTHLTVAAVATTGSYNSLLDKPNLDLYQLRSQAFSGSYNDLTDKPAFTVNYNELINKPDLTQFQTKSEAFTGDYSALHNKPDLSIYALKTGILWGDITNKPTFATVAYSGDYNDLQNRPTLFSGSYVDLTHKPDFSVYQLASSAFNGDYNSLTNKPIIFGGSYTDLTNRPFIPADIADLTDNSHLLGSGGGGVANLGNFKISGNTIGTTDQPDTGGWGGYDFYIDPNGEGWAGIQIPSLSSQENGGALTIYSNKVATSMINLYTRGGVQIASDRGQLNIGTDMEVPGVPSHFHIAFNNSNNAASASDLYFGDDFNYVRLVNSGQGVFVGTNDRVGGSQYEWRFNTDGTLVIPGSIRSNSYNSPELVNIIVPNSPDTAWAYGMSGVDPDYFMQVKFWGGNDVHHGFRIYDVNSSSVPFKVDGTGTTYVNSIQFPDGSTLTTAPSSGGATASIVDYGALDTGSGNATVDLTKTHHLLANLQGNPIDNRRYYLANGTEGQTIYFMPANAYDAVNNVFWVDNYAIYNNGFTSGSGVLKMFEGGIGFVSVQTIVTATFVAGMWHFNGPVTL